MSTFRVDRPPVVDRLARTERIDERPGIENPLDGSRTAKRPSLVSRAIGPPVAPRVERAIKGRGGRVEARGAPFEWTDLIAQFSRSVDRTKLIQRRGASRVNRSRDGDGDGDDVAVGSIGASKDRRNDR